MSCLSGVLADLGTCNATHPLSAYDKKYMISSTPDTYFLLQDTFSSKRPKAELGAKAAPGFSVGRHFHGGKGLQCWDLSACQDQASPGILQEHCGRNGRTGPDLAMCQHGRTPQEPCARKCMGEDTAAPGCAGDRGEARGSCGPTWSLAVRSSLTG